MCVSVCEFLCVTMIIYYCVSTCLCLSLPLFAHLRSIVPTLGHFIHESFVLVPPDSGLWVKFSDLVFILTIHWYLGEMSGCLSVNTGLHCP